MNSRQTTNEPATAAPISYPVSTMPADQLTPRYDKITINAFGKDKKTKTRFFRFSPRRNTLGEGSFATVFPLPQEREDGTPLTKDWSPGYLVKIFNEGTNLREVQEEVKITTRARHLKKNKTGEEKLVNRKAWMVEITKHTAKDDQKRLAMIQSREKGIDLLKVLADPKSYPLSEKEKAQLTLNIIAAMERLHEDGIIHRDLKPENIIVYPETLGVEFVDFGLSKIKNTVPTLGEHVGTLIYLAPEQLFKTGSYSDEKSDDYALVKAVIALLWNIPSREEKEAEETLKEGEDYTMKETKILSCIIKNTEFLLPESASLLQKEIKTLSEEVCKFKPSERLSLRAYRDKLCQLDSFKTALAGEEDVALIEKMATLQIEPTKEKEAQPSKNVLDCKPSGLQTLSLFKKGVQDVVQQPQQIISRPSPSG